MPTSLHFRTDNDTSSDAKLTISGTKYQTFGQKLLPTADKLWSRGHSTGEPGIAKTALAARVTQRYPAPAAHFCIARQADTIEPMGFVRRLSHTLGAIPGFAAQMVRENDITVNAEIRASTIFGTDDARLYSAWQRRSRGRWRAPGAASP